MAERVLCDVGLRVAVDGGGERTLLAVTDGRTVCFWTETALLEATLRGDPVQLSADGGFCGIDVDNGRVRLAFGLADHAPMRCELPAEELADALAWVRSLGSPFEPTPRSATD